MALLLLAVAAGCAGSAYAQLPNIELPDTYHVFPQFAHGVLPDGSVFRSTLMIQQSPGFRPSCVLTLRGMTTRFGSGSPSSTFSIDMPAGGWIAMQTSGAQPFQSGYETLSCTSGVYAQVLYSYYVGGVKVSEATVFSSLHGVSGFSELRLIADQTGNARLGLAIANVSDIQKTYRIQLVTTAGATLATGNMVVPPRSRLPKSSRVLPTTRFFR